MTSSTPRFSRLIWLEKPDCIKTAEPEELDLSSLHLINQNKTERSLFYLSLQTVNVLWVFLLGGGGFLVEVEKIFLYFIALDTHFILPLPHQSLSLSHTFILSFQFPDFLIRFGPGYADVRNRVGERAKR